MTTLAGTTRTGLVARTRRPRVPLSILTPARSVSPDRAALHADLELARSADQLGYLRYWVGGGTDTDAAVVVATIAQATGTIRVGAVTAPGGPIRTAQQARLLDSLFPGRIDLGLVVGADAGQEWAARAVLAALDPPGAPADVRDLVDVETWLVADASVSAARAAGTMGLPFAARHPADDGFDTTAAAISVYRRDFRPSNVLDRPHALVAVDAVVEDQPSEPSGRCPGWSGRTEQIADRLSQLIDATSADELLIIADTDDHRARIRSYERLADHWQR